MFHFNYFISSPGPKDHVSYCHHLVSIVCRPSIVIKDPLVRNYTADGKYDVNNLCVVLYQNYVFGADPKFKMAATAGQSLTLDPIGNTFKDLLVRNYTADVDVLWCERSLCVPLLKLCFWCRSEIQDGRHHGTKFNIGPYGKCLQRSFCQKLHSQWNCITALNILVWSSTNFIFLVQIWNPRWPPPRDKV